MSASSAVPCIDFSLEEAVVQDQLISALTTVGFACLTNTTVWQKAHEYAEEARLFFSQSGDIKAKYHRPYGSVTDHAGWVTMGRERFNSARPGDYKECFNMLRYVKGNDQRAPAQFDNEQFWDLWDNFSELSHKVLRLISSGLGLKDQDQLSNAHTFDQPTGNRSLMRVAWYPKIISDEVKPGQIRCGEHTDYGSVTLLYNDAPGLQVMNRQTGKFEDAGYIQGGLFVNIGDMLQMWSGDVLVANAHRVLIPDEKYLTQERTAVAFFCRPDDDVIIETLDGSGKYPPVISKDWSEAKYAATFD